MAEPTNHSGEKDNDDTPTQSDSVDLATLQNTPQMEAMASDETTPHQNAGEPTILIHQPSASAVFHFPDDPADMTDLPTDRDENPHLHVSQSTAVGSKPSYSPPVNAMQFTRASYPRTIIPYRDLTGNLDDNIKKAIDEEKGNYLAILPFGAGSRYNKEFGLNLKKNLTDFLLSLGFKIEAFDIAQVVPRTKAGRTSDFDKPWIWILECQSKRLRTYLLWYQTFAIRPDLTFTVVPFNKQLKSWVITNITGGAVRDDPQKIAEALGEIKRTLWHNEAFRRIVNDCMAERKVEGSIDERALLATKSYELFFVANKDASGAEVPMWLLTGKPITENEEKHKDYLKVIRSTKFFVGIHALLLEKKFVNCVWCKSDTHPGHACLLPQVEDWNGPKPEY
jgi:hypothetical protein